MGGLYDEVPRELYNKAKVAFTNNDKTEFCDWELGNIGFLASFNGKFFDGGYAKKGYEKTKYGYRLRDYYKEAKANLLKQSKNLSDIEFVCCDYKQYSEMINCVIYCDPPYQGCTQYANSSHFDYNEFWQWCRNMNKRNIVLISELNAPEDFTCVFEKDVSRSLEARNKSMATEKLFEYGSD